VSGPFGKGLIQKEEGTHIAFAAGTGVLCFVDLVAYLALKNLGSTGKAKTLKNQSSTPSAGVKAGLMIASQLNVLQGTTLGLSELANSNKP
jgi:hypothetical protein